MDCILHGLFVFDSQRAGRARGTENQFTVGDQDTASARYEVAVVR
jgi:hypothetical protein